MINTSDERMYDFNDVQRTDNLLRNFENVAGGLLRGIAR